LVNEAEYYYEIKYCCFIAYFGSFFDVSAFHHVTPVRLGFKELKKVRNGGDLLASVKKKKF
jgi:hypothetical protein